MDQPGRKLATPASLALDTVLTLAVFAFFAVILRPHVPSSDPGDIRLWAAVGASCLTGVFWLCLQMFRLVLKAQREQQKK